MPSRKEISDEFVFQPLSSANWAALEKLFGERGACGGCWCMAWRIRPKEFNAQKGTGNKMALQTLAAEGKEPGVLAFIGEQAVGWCAIAPREEYRRLENSRVLKPVDEQPVWSVSCFFIEKEWRNKGLSTALLLAACDFARSKGATIVEGYPTAPSDGRMPDVFVWTGLEGTFKKAGFDEVARRSPTRPIMRKIF